MVSFGPLWTCVPFIALFSLLALYALQALGASITHVSFWSLGAGVAFCALGTSITLWTLSALVPLGALFALNALISSRALRPSFAGIPFIALRALPASRVLPGFRACIPVVKMIPHHVDVAIAAGGVGGLQLGKGIIVPLGNGHIPLFPLQGIQPLLLRADKAVLHGDAVCGQVVAFPGGADLILLLAVAHRYTSP